MSARPARAAAHPPAPPAAYDPWAITSDRTLGSQAKLRRLRELEQLVRQMQVATGEGMPAGGVTLPPLDEVLAALARLDGEHH